MPGMLSHAIFARKAARDLPFGALLAAHDGLFCLGAQGPDIFFYYVPGMLAKRTRGFGTRMHAAQLARFVAAMTDCAAKMDDGQQKDIVFAYAAGFLTHYFLDTHAHPYVYAKTEIHDKKAQNQAEHRHFETSIDTLVAGSLPDFAPTGPKQWRVLFAPRKVLRVAAQAAADAVRATYGTAAGRGAFFGAMRQMICLTRALESRKGRRARVLRRIEKIMGMEALFSSMVHVQLHNPDAHNIYLNSDHKPWAPPWSPQDERRDGFMDIFDAANSRAAHALTVMHSVVYGGISCDALVQVLPERSLHTGL